MKDDRLYWVWLAESFGKGSALAVKLINIFGSAEKVYAASPESINDKGTPTLSAKEAERTRYVLRSKDLSAAEEIAARAEARGQRIVTPADEDFPRSLLNLRDAPMALYVLGRMPRFDRELSVSVVGTRKMTDYGRDAAFSIGYGLGAGGAVVVSGMALGADSMAMTGAIMAGGATVAVLGGGADVIYPKDHKDLYYTILKNGCVISEHPPETPITGRQFPVRNRIISGLSPATVVIEADEGSGALITARHAAYQGRTVFAVPGQIGTVGSAGTNGLLKEGALIATSAEDILSEYEFTFPRSVSVKAAHAALRDVDVSAYAAESMERLRVMARGRNNYYGTSVYGGRGSGPKKGAPPAGDVKMGDEAPETPGFVKVKRDPPPPEDGSPRRIDFDMLDEINIKVYELMTPDVPVAPDELVRPDLPISDVLSSLSLLEIAGAVEAGAGGYFLRRSSDGDDALTSLTDE